jgi:hypothetical protein
MAAMMASSSSARMPEVSQITQKKAGPFRGDPHWTARGGHGDTLKNSPLSPSRHAVARRRARDHRGLLPSPSPAIDFDRRLERVARPTAIRQRGHRPAQEPAPSPPVAAWTRSTQGPPPAGAGRGDSPSVARAPAAAGRRAAVALEGGEQRRELRERLVKPCPPPVLCPCPVAPPACAPVAARGLLVGRAARRRSRCLRVRVRAGGRGRCGAAARARPGRRGDAGRPARSRRELPRDRRDAAARRHSPN